MIVAAFIVLTPISSGTFSTIVSKGLVRPMLMAFMFQIKIIINKGGLHDALGHSKLISCFPSTLSPFPTCGRGGNSIS